MKLVLIDVVWASFGCHVKVNTTSLVGLKPAFCADVTPLFSDNLVVFVDNFFASADVTAFSKIGSASGFIVPLLL